MRNKKKAFSLVETAVAITIVMIGLTAIISIGLSSLSAATAAKLKSQATAEAQTILETFRTARDNGGIASFSSVRSSILSQPIHLGEVDATPVITIYWMDSHTAIVEVRLNWNYKEKTESVSFNSTFPNLDNGPTLTPGVYATPTWYRL